jgi:hypothetical protein
VPFGLLRLLDAHDVPMHGKAKSATNGCQYGIPTQPAGTLRIVGATSEASEHLGPMRVDRMEVTH